MALAPCTLVVISYVHVVAAVLRIRSAEGWRKAFSTWGTHITMVHIFYITSVLCYILSSSAYFGLRDRVFSVLYVVLAPVLHPIIYSMRNKEVKRALFKALGKESDSSVQGHTPPQWGWHMPDALGMNPITQEFGIWCRLSIWWILFCVPSFPPFQQRSNISVAIFKF